MRPITPRICDLPELVSADGWEWEAVSQDRHQMDGFWTAVDGGGQKWLFKLRGRNLGLRELAFARLAQHLGWSCQSSQFVVLPASAAPMLGAHGRGRDVVQLAQWFYAEADYSSETVRSLLTPLDSLLNKAGSHPLDAIRRSPIKAHMDWPRSDVAACLFGATEPCGRLLTTDLANVIIDSELMFASGPDLTFATCWLQADEALGRNDGWRLTLEVCDAIARLAPHDLYAFARLPPGIVIDYQEQVLRSLEAGRLAAIDVMHGRCLRG